MNKIDRIVSELREFAPLAAGDEYQLRRIAIHVTEHRSSPGDVLVRQGEPARAVHLLVGGRAAVSVDDTPVGIVGPGSIIGEMGMLDHSQSSATVTVTEPGLVLTVDRLGFESLLDSPAANRAIGAALAQRVRRAEHRAEVPGDEHQPVSPDQ